MPTYEFHFMNCMSLENREKEVARFIRNRYDSEAQVSNLVATVSLLEEEARWESPDASAHNVLAYCRYFGAPKHELKSIAMLYGLRAGGDAFVLTAVASCSKKGLVLSRRVNFVLQTRC